MRRLMGISLMLAGCFGAHGEDDEGLVAVVDGGSAEAPCGRIGSAIRCGGECPPVDCGEGSSCDEVVGHCVYDQDRCWLWRDRSDTGGNMRYCPSGRLCAIDTERAARSDWSGPCVDPAYCAEAAGSGDQPTCWYVDRTPYVDGPPEEACPPSPHGFSHFCGGECGGCDPFPSPFTMTASACAGVNEERGLGLCVFGAERVCERDANESGRIEYFEGITREREWGPIACMALVGEDGELPDWGWFVFEEGCRAYRDRYPGQVECVDNDWQPLE